MNDKRTALDRLTEGMGKNQGDVWKHRASLLYGKNYEDVTDEERAAAKRRYHMMAYCADDAQLTADFFARMNPKVIGFWQRVGLFIQACLPPWPLRFFESEDMGTVTSGWVHDDGRIFITKVRHIIRMKSAGTETGRFSSKGPNMSNPPKSE